MTRGMVERFGHVEVASVDARHSRIGRVLGTRTVLLRVAS